MKIARKFRRCAGLECAAKRPDVSENNVPLTHPYCVNDHFFLGEIGSVASERRLRTSGKSFSLSRISDIGFFLDYRLADAREGRVSSAYDGASSRDRQRRPRTIWPDLSPISA
jgi:hypothetical protein